MPRQARREALQRVLRGGSTRQRPSYVPGLPLGPPGARRRAGGLPALGCYNPKRTFEGRAHVGKYFSAAGSGVSGDAFSTAPAPEAQKQLQGFRTLLPCSFAASAAAAVAPILSPSRAM